jgi:hypothetical protein
MGRKLFERHYGCTEDDLLSKTETLVQRMIARV